VVFFRLRDPHTLRACIIMILDYMYVFGAVRHYSAM
jgi:hypothetical protein